jgi:GNAT superfamily N-acetyltransferase
VSPVTIRPGAIADANQISELVHDVVPTLAYGPDEAIERFLHEQYSPDVIRAGIATGSRRWLVAIRSDMYQPEVICGTIYLDPVKRYLGGLHVSERRQGTGRALMGAMVTIADDLRVGNLHGSVLVSNHASLALTSQHGFVMTGPDRHKVYFPDAPFMIIERESR